MRTYLPNEITKTHDLTYHFVTDNYDLYFVEFSFSDRFFDEKCTYCKDILEVVIKCEKENCPKDYRVGATIFTIFSEILSDSCN